MNPGRCLRLTAVALLLATACAPVAIVPQGTVLANLFESATVRHTLRGRATVSVSNAGRGASFPQVVVVELPDRARFEAQTTLGSTALVLTLDGNRLRYHSFLAHEYVAAPATLATLDRLAGIPVPPGPLLRLLLGLTPLPLDRSDPRLAAEPEGAGFRLESVEGSLWQRLWTGPGGVLARGELGQAGHLLLRFEFADYRPVEGLPFPFVLHVEDGEGVRKLAVRYDAVTLNEPIPADLFDLPRPTDDRTKIRELPGS